MYAVAGYFTIQVDGDQTGSVSLINHVNVLVPSRNFRIMSEIWVYFVVRDKSNGFSGPRDFSVKLVAGGMTLNNAAVSTYMVSCGK